MKPSCSRIPAAFAITAILLAACGGGGGATSLPAAGSGSANPTPSPTASAAATSSSGIGSATAQACPSAAPTSSGTLDCGALPLGDLKYSTTAPKAGYIYSCTAQSGSPAATGPWIDTANGTWNGNAKIAVQGAVSWGGTFSESSNGTTRTIAGNAEPISPVTTGSYPIQSTDPAYAYDRNPNSIAAHAFSFSVPANPSPAPAPGCLRDGPIGVALDGAMIYDGFDAAGYDAVAHEVQDTCHGHPDGSDVYHYHGWIQACVPDTGSATRNSSLLGYAADGYGIYGPWYNGKVLTTADLDECHGTTSQVMWDGKLVTMYHYVSTYDFPYTLGCYHGTQVSIGVP